MAAHDKISTTWKGLQVQATIVIGDTEGDPSIPRGVNYLDPYVEELEITAPDGDDLTEDLTSEAIDEIITMILDESGHWTLT